MRPLDRVTQIRPAATEQASAANIAANGLHFTYDQRIDAGDAILLRWSMLTPDGTAVDRGVELLFRDKDGKIHTDYLFMSIS